MKFLNFFTGCALVWFKAFVIAALFNWHVAPLIGANPIGWWPMVFILFLLTLGTIDPYVVRKAPEDEATELRFNLGMAFWVAVAYVVGWLLTLLH